MERWIYQTQTPISAQCCAVLPTWQHCLSLLVFRESEIERAKRSSRALVHFVTARASLFPDHRMSGLSIRAKYRHVMTIWRHSPIVYNFSPFEVMVVKTWCGDLKKLALHNIHNRGSRSTKTAPVSEQWLLSTSSPPSMVSSFVFWPSSCVPCSRRYNSRHALLQMWANCPRRKFKSTSSPSPMVLSLGLWS